MKLTEQNEYAFVLSTASLLLALNLTGAENSAERKEKKRRVCEKKRDAIKTTFSELRTAGDEKIMSSVAKSIQSKWSDDDRALLLVDLAFSDPFFPYELKTTAKEFEKGFSSVAELIGVRGLKGINDAKAKEILAIKKDALESQKESRFWPILLTASALAVVCGLGGYFAAPALAAKIGAGAGLYGAAATSYGLALLGGGSLAAGGLGMAGGLWIVTGLSATVAGVVSTGAQLFRSMGSDQARGELIKLQVSFKAVLLQRPEEAVEAVKVLNKDGSDIEDFLKIEMGLNESDSTRVKDLKLKLKAIQNSIKWMNSQLMKHGRS